MSERPQRKKSSVYVPADFAALGHDGEVPREPQHVRGPADSTICGEVLDDSGVEVPSARRAETVVQRRAHQVVLEAVAGAVLREQALPDQLVEGVGDLVLAVTGEGGEQWEILGRRTAEHRGGFEDGPRGGLEPDEALQQLRIRAALQPGIIEGPAQEMQQRCGPCPGHRTTSS